MKEGKRRARKRTSLRSPATTTTTIVELQFGFCGQKEVLPNANISVDVLTVLFLHIQGLYYKMQEFLPSKPQTRALKPQTGAGFSAS